YTIYHADNVIPSGDHEINTYHVWSPAIGTLVVLLPGLGAYASWMKGLEETGQAPIGSANQFQVCHRRSRTRLRSVCGWRRWAESPPPWVTSTSIGPMRSSTRSPTSMRSMGPSTIRVWNRH